MGSFDGGVKENRRILIVDDNPAIHDDFRKILSGSSSVKDEIKSLDTELFGVGQTQESPAPEYEIDSAFQGEEAIGMIRESIREGRPYALAFVDIRMPPGWDGVETMEHVWVEDPRVQFVICTAYSDYKWSEISRRLGECDDFVVLKKPFDNIEVKQLTAAMVRKWNNARAAEHATGVVDDMLKQRTQDLLSTEKSLAATFKSISDAVIVADSEALIIGMNPVAEELVGRSEADCMLLPLGEVYTTVDSVSRQPVENIIERITGEGRVKALSGEGLLIRGDGREIPVSDSGSVVRGEDDEEVLGFVVVFRDVTEERLSAIRLRKSNEQMSMIMDSVHAGIVLVDPDTRTIVDVNDYASRLIGVDRAFLCGKDCYEYICSSAHDSCIVDENADSVEYIEDFISNSAGEKIPIMKSVVRAEVDGRELFVESFVDISSRKASENRFSRLNECLLGFGSNPVKNIERISAVAGEFFNADMVFYSRVERDLLVLSSGWNIPKEYHREIPVRGGLCEDVMLVGDGEPKVYGDLQNSEFARTDVNVKDCGLQTIFCHAIKCYGKTIGVFCVGYRSDVECSDADHKLLGILAAAASIEEERLSAEDQKNKAFESQTVLNLLLRSSLSKTSLDQILQNALDSIFYASWMSTLPRGAIFLVGENPELLEMKAQRDLPEALRESCATVPFGKCLCGTAASERQVIFSDGGDDIDIECPAEVGNYGHYIVPILYGDEVLGVIDLYLARGHKRDDHEISFLEAVANTLAGLIKRKKAEEALTRSNDALVELNRRLHENQRKLVQSEKMASLGQLAAGVAHEINNPVSFVKSNLGTLEEYASVFRSLFRLQDDMLAKVADNDLEGCAGIAAEVERIKEEEDLAYLLDDLGQLLHESVEGTERVRDIVLNLKSFARLDEAAIKEADINEGIEATLKIVWNELKYKCEVHKDLKPLPRIRCYPGQLNQVFMNLLVNAAHAIEERGDIVIRTSADDEAITVVIGDTGSGISPENMSKLFDPFFTTKEVGKGTGLGLSISHGIIEKHKGSIDVNSTVGKGTVFTIRLPIGGIDDGA